MRVLSAHAHTQFILIRLNLYNVYTLCLRHWHTIDWIETKEKLIIINIICSFISLDASARARMMSMLYYAIDQERNVLFSSINFIRLEKMWNEVKEMRKRQTTNKSDDSEESLLLHCWVYDDKIKSSSSTLNNALSKLFWRPKRRKMEVIFMWCLQMSFYLSPKPEKCNMNAFVSSSLVEFD